jgi:hypothetical protein
MAKKSVATPVKKEVDAMATTTATTPPAETVAAPLVAAPAAPAAAETAPVATEAIPAAAEAPATTAAQETQKELLIKFIAQRGGISLAQARVWFNTKLQSKYN